MKYTELTFTGLVNKIGSSRYFDLPKMLKEAFTRLTPQAPKYKVYTALLTQSGTNAPVATVLENTLGGDLAWTRISDGVYNATLSVAFVENKTFLNLSYNRENDVTGSSEGVVFRVNQNTIQLETGVIGDIRFDSILIDTPIEIRVYN